MGNDQNLPPEHVFQRNFTECVWCCASMVHSHFGRPRTVDDIRRALKITKPPFYGFAGQLASYLSSQQFESRLVVSTTKLIPPAWHSLSGPELAKNLYKWADAHEGHPLRVEVEHISEFAQAGGKVVFRPLTSGLLTTMLGSGSLIIPFLDEVRLWGSRFVPDGTVDDRQGQTWGHAVLLTRLLNGKVEVFDPFPTGIAERNGHYFVDPEDIVQATLTWDAMMVEVRLPSK